MIVYKVVYYSKTHKFLSAIVHDKSIGLVYELGVVTKPRTGTPIFAFSDIDSAIEFVNPLRNRLVLECDAGEFTGNLPPLDKVRAKRYNIPIQKVNTRRMMKFWKSDNDQRIQLLYSHLTTPYATVFCDWVKPIKLIGQLEL